MTDVKNATPITRDEAMALGLPRFFTGKPCINGHVAERYVVGSRGCIECARLSAAESYRTRDKVRDAERTRARSAKLRNYAPPPLERDCPPRPSDGLCDCCLKPPRLFCLDHDHETGAFRGWICAPCNTATGIIDDSERLRNRADFLEGNLPWQ